MPNGSDTGTNGGTQSGTRRLVAVVVTHNRLAQLKITLARLLDSPPAHLEGVVIVDNASQDDTLAFLAQQTDPRVVVVRAKTNLGGAGGFDLGLRRAVAEFEADWFVVMDDDARPEPGALQIFGSRALPDVDAVAAAVYHPTGEICAMNVPWRNPFWHHDVFWRTITGGGRAGFHLGPEAYARSDIQPIDGGSFVGLFVSRAAITLTGYPDPDLFIYGDDVLYTLALTQNGGRIVFDPAIRFEHDFTTLSDGVQRFVPLWKCYYHHRNLLLVYRRAAGMFFWPSLVLILPKWASKIRHYTGQKRAFWSLLCLAVSDGLRQNISRPHEEIAARFSDDG